MSWATPGTACWVRRPPSPMWPHALTKQLCSLTVPYLLGTGQGPAGGPQVPETKSGDSPSPQAAPSTLGQKQRPCPWEVAAGGHRKASPGWPQALSFLVVNYSVCGSACSASAPATPPLMAKIDGFLISLGQKTPSHAARGSCLHCTADRGPNLEGGLSQTYFHHLFT